MFNLEEAIAGWRSQMASRGVKPAAALDELEDHLREEIQLQLRNEVSEERAFNIAIARVGGAGELAREFRKTEHGKQWSVFFRTSFFIFIAGVFGTNGLVLLEYELTRFQRALGFGAIAVICFYMVCVPWLLQRLSTGGLARLAGIIKVTSFIAFVWPMCSLLDALGVIHLGMDIVTNTIVWCLLAAVVLTGFIYGMVMAGDGSGFGGAARAGCPDSPLLPSAPQSEPLLRSATDENVQRAFAAAREEARRLGHSYLGTEHVLLGLLKHADGPFGSMLRKLHVEPQTLTAEIEQRIYHGFATPGQTFSAVTPKARKALGLAAKHARHSHRHKVTTSDVFVGLVLEGRGLAAVVLKHFGIRADNARKALTGEPDHQHS